MKTQRALRPIYREKRSARAEKRGKPPGCKRNRKYSIRTAYFRSSIFRVAVKPFTFSR